MVVSGSVSFRVADETRELGPGGTWRIAPDVPHEVHTGPEGAVVIDVFSPPREDWAALERAEPRPGSAVVLHPTPPIGEQDLHPGHGERAEVTDQPADLAVRDHLRAASECAPARRDDPDRHAVRPKTLHRNSVSGNRGGEYRVAGHRSARIDRPCLPPAAGDPSHTPGAQRDVAPARVHAKRDPVARQVLG